jgi:hypothetical protein
MIDSNGIEFNTLFINFNNVENGKVFAWFSDPLIVDIIVSIRSSGFKLVHWTLMPSPLLNWN